MKHDPDTKTPPIWAISFISFFAGGLKFHYLREWLVAAELISVPVSVWSATLALAIAFDIAFVYALRGSKRGSNPHHVLSGFMCRFVGIPAVVFYLIIAFPNTLFAEIVLAFFTWFVAITTILAIFTILFSMRKEKSKDV